MLGERDKADIRTLYRDAADKSRQVRILMELFLASREEILDVLGPMAEPGRPKPSKKGLPKRSYIRTRDEFYYDTRTQTTTILTACGTVRTVSGCGWEHDAPPARMARHALFAGLGQGNDPRRK